MSAKTKIVVLHLKELIYTGIFAVLGIIFIVVLIFMFLPGSKAESSSTSGSESQSETEAAPTEVSYNPGTYSTGVTLNGSTFSVEVTVDDSSVTGLQLVNMEEAVATMYPLIEPSFTDLSNQILEKQDLEKIVYADDSRYTSQLLINAVKDALNQAATANNAE